MMMIIIIIIIIIITADALFTSQTRSSPFAVSGQLLSSLIDTSLSLSLICSFLSVTCAVPIGD